MSSILTKPLNINIDTLDTSVKITWDPVVLADYYDVVLFLADTKENLVTQSTDNPEIILEDLIPSTRYTVQVVAKTKTTDSPPAAITFETLSDTPETTDVESCLCELSIDCLNKPGCAGKPMCNSGVCTACIQGQPISEYSECYENKMVCSTDSTCTSCTMHDECVKGYGENFQCNIETGQCHYVEKSTMKIGILIFIIFIVLFFILLLGGIIALIATRK